jgi:hypothetical protein
MMPYLIERSLRDKSWHDLDDVNMKQIVSNIIHRTHLLDQWIEDRSQHEDAEDRILDPLHGRVRLEERESDEPSPC